MRGIGLAILIAAFGAIGNGLFAYAQRRATVQEAPFSFVSVSLVSALAICLAASIFMKGPGPIQVFQQSGQWAFWTGAGLAATLICFNLLFTRYGATFYVLYSVMAILTTTFLVGQLLLREPINIYHVGAILLAIGSVLLFTLGQTRLQS